MLPQRAIGEYTLSKGSKRKNFQERKEKRDINRIFSKVKIKFLNFVWNGLFKKKKKNEKINERNHEAFLLHLKLYLLFRSKAHLISPEKKWK